jgi:hypothetical protein
MGAFVVFQKQFECFVFFAQHRAGRKYLVGPVSKEAFEQHNLTRFLTDQF